MKKLSEIFSINPTVNRSTNHHSNKIENVLNLLLEEMKKGNSTKFKAHLEKFDCITTTGKEGNNIFHFIALQKKGEKKKYLNVVLSHATDAQRNDDLKKALNTKNQNGLTPLQVALNAKIKKKKHIKEISNEKDNTVIFIKKLIENGADINQLKLPKKTLDTLSETQKKYYYKFLNTLEKYLGVFEERRTTELQSESDEFCKKHNNQNLTLYFSVEGEKITKKNSIEARPPSGNDSIPFTNNYQRYNNSKIGESNNESSKTVTKSQSKPENFTRIDNNIRDSIHSVALAKNPKEFTKILKRIPNPTITDKQGNNIFHLIIQQKKEKKVEYPKITLNYVKNSNFLLNNKNENGLTPLHILLKHIMEKKSTNKPFMRNFKSTNRYKSLEVLMENGADIAIQDEDGNNAIHRIALFKREQKVTCFNLILRLVEEGKISKEKLIEAVNATNGKGKTPLKLVLEKKATKEPCNHLSQSKKIACSLDNTSKFCVLLLKNGANHNSLWLEDEKYHTKRYYLTSRNLKECLQISPEAREEANKVKLMLEEKYKVKTVSKYAQHTAKKTVSFMKKTALTTGKALCSVVKYIDPAKKTRELLATIITTAVVAMTVFAFFQGQITIGAALPIIAITGAICLALTSGFDAIKNFVIKPNEEQTSQVSSKIDDISVTKNCHNRTVNP